MSIPIPTYPGVTITRNADGIPIVDAPNILLAIEAEGYIHVFDRPWQTFLNLKTGQGLLASVVGPVTEAINSDVFVKTISYLPADILTQYNALPQSDRERFEAYVRGVNARFTELINNPALRPIQFTASGTVPETFTALDIFQYAYLIVYNFSSSTRPVFQLTNLANLRDISIINGPVADTLIFNDYAGVNNVTRARWTMTDGDACGDIGDQNLEPCPINIGPGFNLPSTYSCIQEGIESFEQLQQFWISNGIGMVDGSRSIVLGRQKTARNDILMHGAAQAGQAAPSPVHLTILNAPERSVDAMTFPGVPTASLMPNVRVGCFCFTTAVQVGTFHARDIGLQTMADTFIYNSGTIPVKGSTSVPFTVRWAGTPAAPTGRDLTTISPNGIPGVLTIERSVFIGQDMKGAVLLGFLPFTLSSYQDFLALVTSPQQTDLLGSVVSYSDNECNIGAIHMGVRTRLPSTVNRKLPQTNLPIPGFTNPLLPISAYEIVPPAITVNSRPYYAYWNGPWSPLQDTNIYRDYEYNRANWIYQVLDRYGQISYQQLPEILALLGDSRLFASGFAMEREPLSNGNTAPLNNSTDAFLLIRDRFISVLQAATSTPVRQEGLALLQDYDGRWIGGNLQNIVTSPNVLDSWMLANTWLAIVQEVILQPRLGSIILSRTVPWRSSTDTVSLLIRILVNPCNNPLFFSGWPTGSTLDAIILAAYDQAYSELSAPPPPGGTGFGPRPWGTALRRNFQFRNTALATIVPPGTIAEIPYLQHGTHESNSEIQPVGIIRRGHIFAPGVTEQIDIVGGIPVAAPSSINLVENFQFFDLSQFGPRTVDPSCIPPVPPVPPRPGRDCTCPGGCFIADPLRRNQLCYGLNRN